jgi:AcrR family transcriptional regulator
VVHLEAQVGEGRAAGVAVQTVYNAVGSKRAVLSRVLDHAAAGNDAPTPVPVFMRERAEREPDPGRILDRLVEFWAGGLERTAPVFGVIRQAAALDPEIADLDRARAAQRLSNYGIAARLLADRGALRPGLSPDEAAASIFAVGHPEVYRALVLDQGWSRKRWSAWARDTLGAALLAAEGDRLR